MGITEKDIVIPNKKDIGTIAEYKEKGYIKHAWINENPESPEYKYSVVGIHLPDKVPNKPNYLNEDWIYYEKI